MDKIQLLSTTKKNRIITYKYCVSEKLQKYFSGKEFLIEYPYNIESVPDSIAVIPFVANVLPIIWLTDSELIVDELDEDFYNCIPALKSGYKTMFPETDFKGIISVKKVRRCAVHGDKCAMFYSGGLDSAQTLISHYKENPDLLSVWGSDIKYDNIEGWEIVQKGLEEGAEQFGFHNLVIHTSFRDYDNEGALDRDFSAQLKDGWWHGVKHGIGLLGHAAPLAYLRGYKNLYIASSNCPDDGAVRCASNPVTDNTVKFANCQVYHDGFEFSRQDKCHNVVEFSKYNQPIKLHVCWQSQSGKNCCHCEKCYRTMFGILAEEGNPKDFGFEDFETAIRQFDLGWLLNHLFNLKKEWTHIAHRIKENKNLRNTIYWKKLKLVRDFDYRKPETFSIPFVYKVKKKSKNFLRRVKNKLIRIKRNVDFKRYLKKNLNKSILLIGTPSHSNIGDSAIVVAEKRFIESLGYKEKEITFNEYNEFYKIIDKFSRAGKLVCLNGGGNMGNQWLPEEYFRRRAMTNIENKRQIIFPQTIYYTPDEKGEEEKKKSIGVYSNKNDLTIVAREKVSYDIMKKLYPNTNILFTPDIVLSADPKIFNIFEHNREGVLFIMRMDKERSMDDDSRKQLMDEIKNLGLNYIVSDMHSDKPVTKENREGIVSAKMNEFATAKLVITDRLHGMIFAAITGTPCIVFSNYNHKVKGTYDWISYLPYIKYVDTVDKAKELIPEMLEMKNCKYDNSLLLPHFDKLKDVIKSNAEN